MDKVELIRHLEAHARQPQSSERWAMYRLIVPVVDAANSALGLEVYFEFNQTSAHATSQSVDIALRDASGTRVMVEAKRVDREISAEQISKYLSPDTRGVVTNGVDWVLCCDRKNKVVSLFERDRRSVSVDALEEILEFIAGHPVTDVGWTSEVTYVAVWIRPRKPLKDRRALRVSNAATRVHSIHEFTVKGASLADATPMERVLLESVADRILELGNWPIHLRCEVRSSRVVFFDDRIPSGSQRVARIELGTPVPSASGHRRNGTSGSAPGSAGRAVGRRPGTCRHRPRTGPPRADRAHAAGVHRTTRSPTGRSQRRSCGRSPPGSGPRAVPPRCRRRSFGLPSGDGQ